MTTLYLNTNALMCTLKTVGMALMVGLSPVVLQAQWQTLINHNFTGWPDINLSGTAVGGFDSAKITGVTGNWLGSQYYKADGSINRFGDHARSAHIDLGGYIDNTKGTSSGLFRLTGTVEPTDGWLSLGFSTLSSPRADFHYTENGTNGFATFRYWSNNDLETSLVQGFSTIKEAPAYTGAQTFTVELDYTTWNGTTDYGTITWFVGATEIRSVVLDATTGANIPRSILISGSASGATGSFSNISLQQRVFSN